MGVNTATEDGETYGGVGELVPVDSPNDMNGL